jgi:peptidoglycan/LPS O-acetylase OafA/YrhL
LVVLVGHLSYFTVRQVNWTSIALYLNQGSAVYGFLIISGYSIAASIERSATGFYQRRFWRIYPTYVASIALAIAASACVAHGLKAPFALKFEPISIGGVLVALLILQSFLAQTISTDGQLWTLAVEWWNYMLAPLFKRCASIFLSLLLLGSLIAFLYRPPPPYPDKTSGGLMFVLLTWLWLVGFLYYRHRRTVVGYTILFFPLVVAGTFGWVGRAVIIGLIAVAFCEDVPVPVPFRSAFRWLGELSYPVYAVHVPVLVFCLALGVRSPGLTLVVALIASMLVLHLIDLPLRTWGALFGRRAHRGAQVSSATAK